MWFMKIIYIIIWIGVALFNILYLPEFSMYLFLFLTILPILLFVLVHISGYFTKFSLQARDSICCGKGCYLNGYATSFLPIGSVKIVLEIRHVPTGDTLIVPARISAHRTIKYEPLLTLAPEHCGIFDISVKKIKIYDPLYLFSHTKKYKFSTRITIYPITLPPTSTPKFNTLSDTSGILVPTIDHEDPIGIRSYHEGDRMRDIHWKLSAKTEQPVVREFGMPAGITLKVGLYWNLKSADGAVADQFLQGVWAIFCLAQVASTPLQFFLPNDLVVSVSDFNDVSCVLEQILLQPAVLPPSYDVCGETNALLTTANPEVAYSGLLFMPESIATNDAIPLVNDNGAQAVYSAFSTL